MYTTGEREKNPALEDCHGSLSKKAAARCCKSKTYQKTNKRENHPLIPPRRPLSKSAAADGAISLTFVMQLCIILSASVYRQMPKTISEARAKKDA